MKTKNAGISLILFGILIALVAPVNIVNSSIWSGTQSLDSGFQAISLTLGIVGLILVLTSKEK
jgi:hypothetical protein